ncbi:MAG: iron ABC transporter permease [Bauldia sp.]|nr:iron ABC transporter permease [Bauldia sp.]
MDLSATAEFARSRQRRRAFAALAIAGVLLVLAIGTATAFGAVTLRPAQVLNGLFDGGDLFARQVVRDLRLPRVLVAALVGAGLAIAGAILQAVTRNPLGDPHIFGFSAGAGVAAIALLLFVPGYPTGLVPLAAFVGSLAAAAIVFALAWRGGISPVRFALAGVAVAALFTAISTTLIASSDLFTQAVLAFLAGGLYLVNWNDLWTVLPYTIVAGAIAIALADWLNILALGDDVARSVGLRVDRARLVLVGLAAVLTAAAVSVAGLIGFVGLVAPHVARLIVGSDERFAMPLAAILGAFLVVVADVVARVVIAPSEIPVGILTAIVGAPVLLILVRTRT